MWTELPLYCSAFRFVSYFQLCLETWSAFSPKILLFFPFGNSGATSCFLDATCVRKSCIYLAPWGCSVTKLGTDLAILASLVIYKFPTTFTMCWFSERESCEGLWVVWGNGGYFLRGLGRSCRPVPLLYLMDPDERTWLWLSPARWCQWKSVYPEPQHTLPPSGGSSQIPTLYWPQWPTHSLIKCYSSIRNRTPTMDQNY